MKPSRFTGDVANENLRRLFAVVIQRKFCIVVFSGVTTER